MLLYAISQSLDFDIECTSDRIKNQILENEKRGKRKIDVDSSRLLFTKQTGFLK